MNAKSVMIKKSIAVISIGSIALSVATWVFWINKEWTRTNNTSKSLAGESKPNERRDAHSRKALGKGNVSDAASALSKDTTRFGYSWLIEKAKLNPIDALNYLDTLHDERQRAETIAHIAIGWAEADPDSCYEWVWSLGNFNEKSAGLVQFANTLANLKRINELLPFIDKTPKGESRDDMIVFSMAGILDADFEQGVRIIGGVSGKGALSAIGQTMASHIISERSMAEASAIVEGMEHGAFREYLNASLTKEFASVSPQDGLQWFSKNVSHSIDGTRQALSFVAAAFAASDPENGILMSKSIVDKAQNRFLSEKIGSGWVVADTGGAQSWMMEEITQGRFEENIFAIKGIISESVRIENTSIFEKLEQINNESLKRDMTRTAAIALAEFNPALATEKLASGFRQDSNADAKAMSEIVSHWLARDPLAASEWARDLNSGRLRDVAVERVVDNIIQIDSDIGAARMWVDSVSDNQVRAKLLKKLALVSD